MDPALENQYMDIQVRTVRSRALARVYTSHGEGNAFIIGPGIPIRPLHQLLVYPREEAHWGVFESIP